MSLKEKNTPSWIRSNVKLTIGVLVSNNIGTIQKCMDSLLPILYNVSSELIVVDTVGEEQSDGSLAIAKKYATKVFHFDWCNDFSLARNICIDHAEGEWFLYVDDDEWFEDVKEIISFFQSGESNQYGQGIYHIRNYSADGTYTIALVSRLFRRTTKTRFIGKVHEEMTDVYLPKKLFSIYANHSGYAFQNEEERVKKQNRNINILEKEIKEQGLNSARASQMVQELLSNMDTADKGYQYCMQYIEELKTTGQLVKPTGQWLLVASARYFAMTGKFEQLFQQAEWIRSNYSLSQTAQLALAVTSIFPAVKQNKMELVAKYAEIYFINWDWLKLHKEEALLQLQLDFSAFLTEEYYEKIVYISAVTANHMQNYRLANVYWKRLPWNREGFDGTRYARDLQITIEGLKKVQKWNQIQELLDMLVDGTKILELNIENEVFHQLENKERLELLQCMQESAITIGTSMDELLGEGTEIVTQLELFCELVWNCSQIINREELKSIIKEMQELLSRIAMQFQQF